MTNHDTVSVRELNLASLETATRIISSLIELSPWLAPRIVTQRPFASAQVLATCITEAIHNLTDSERLSLLRAHPVLAPKEPHAMTSESQQEQSRLGFMQPTASQVKQLDELNEQYLARFGFPFIIALHSRESLEQVLQIFEQRLNASVDSELQTAVEEITSVSRSRVHLRFAHSLADKIN